MANNLEKNLSVLSDEYCDKILSAEKPLWYSDSKSLNGDNNFCVYTAGIEKYAYDKKAAKRTAKDMLNGFSLAKNDVCVLIGIGLGNTLNLLLEKSHPNSKIICFEPIWYMMKKGLERYSFTKALSAARVILCSTPEELVNAISVTENFNVIERWFIIKEPYTQYIFNNYIDGATKSEELINMIQCNIGTVSSAGKQIALNDVKNIPILAKKPGITNLKDRFKDSAAIVVSTGPSLKKNIHILLDKRTREKCVVICVAQALRTLLGYGIEPDFACTVDFGEVNESHFIGLEDCGIPLIALNRAYSEIFNSWKGDIFVSGNGGEKNGTLSDIWVDKGNTLQGGSVSHFALSLASYFGCKKIALIGQDLAYDESMVSHVAGTDSSGKISITESGELMWDVDDGHSCIAGTKQSLGHAWHAPGYWGGEVITNAGLQSFSTAFTSIAKSIRKKSRVFNCTEGGMNINGIRRVMLKDFVEFFAASCKYEKCKLDIPDDFLAIEKAVELCKNDIKDIEIVSEKCKEGIESAEKMKTASGEELKNLFTVNHKVSTEAHKIAAKNQILTISIFKASRDVAGQMNTTCKNIENDESVLMKRIERNQYILKEAAKVADELLPVYKDVLKKLIDIESGKEIEKPEPKKISADEFQRQVSKGNWQFVFSQKTFYTQASEYWDLMQKRNEEIKKATAEYELNYSERKKKIKVIHCIERAKEVGMLLRKWKHALRLLKIAENEDPTDTTVAYGIAACLFMLSRYSESLCYYEFVLADEKLLNRKQILDEVDVVKTVMRQMDGE